MIAVGLTYCAVQRGARRRLRTAARDLMIFHDTAPYLMAGLGAEQSFAGSALKGS
jgi:hypothetical protein